MSKYSKSGGARGRKPDAGLLRKLSQAIEQTADLVLITDRDGVIEYVNPAFERTTGYARRDVLGRKPSLLKSDRHEPAFYAELWHSILAGHAFRALFTNRKKNGELYVEEKTVSPLRDASGAITHFVSTGKDVTERLQDAEALRQSRALMQAIFDSAEDAILISDDRGCYVDANPAACRLLGYAREELLGLDTARLTPASHLGALVRERGEFLRVGIQKGEFPRLRKDGRTVVCEYTAVANILPGLHLSILRDVTEKKRLEEHLLDAQKMESIGRLAGGIAHDFNNLLTVILGRCHFMLAAGPLGVRQSNDLQEIRRTSERAASLTRQLLAFSRRQVLQPEVLDVNLIVKDMRSMLRRLVCENIKMAFGLADGLDPVKVDRGQLEQVLMNLVVNARDAMPRGGTLSIETANAHLDGARAGRHPALPPGRYVLLAVRDTGTGMDAETLAHVFEPFFTTKALGHGTGLGLATVYGIVHQSGGNISVQSAPGQGASFEICLPAVVGVGLAERAASSSSAAAPTVRCSETILVAEDEAETLGLICEILSQQGYGVLTARSAEEAMQAANGCAAPIALLLTDVVMPGKSGKDLANELKDRRPQMKILFMSGYTYDAIAQYGVVDLGTHLIEKPFTPNALCRRVRELLDAAS